STPDPCRYMWRRPARHIRNTPVRFTPTTRCHSASDTSVAAFMDSRPAFACTTSSRPSVARMSSTIAPTAPASATSQPEYRASPPAAMMSLTVRWASSAATSATMTRAPAAANAIADAAPIPVAPPETQTTWPVKLKVASAGLMTPSFSSVRRPGRRPGRRAVSPGWLPRRLAGAPELGPDAVQHGVVLTGRQRVRGDEESVLPVGSDRDPRVAQPQSLHHLGRGHAGPGSVHTDVQPGRGLARLVRVRACGRYPRQAV